MWHAIRKKKDPAAVITAGSFFFCHNCQLKMLHQNTTVLKTATVLRKSKNRQQYTATHANDIKTFCAECIIKTVYIDAKITKKTKKHYLAL